MIIYFEVMDCMRREKCNMPRNVSSQKCNMTHYIYMINVVIQNSVEDLSFVSSLRRWERDGCSNIHKIQQNTE